MLVRDVMSSPAVAVRPQTSLKEATQLLARHSITAMPVVDGDDRLVGVISEADLIQDALLDDPRAHELPVQVAEEATGSGRPTLVSDLMTRQVLSVPPQADLAEAADLLTSTALKSLPVIEHGKVVGMISRRDIVHVLARRDADIRAEIDELFRVSHEMWTVDVQDGIVEVDGPATEHERELALVLISTVPGVVGLRFGADATLRRPHETGRTVTFPRRD